jgi:hypothetical protein
MAFLYLYVGADIVSSQKFAKLKKLDAEAFGTAGDSPLTTPKASKPPKLSQTPKTPVNGKKGGKRGKVVEDEETPQSPVKKSKIEPVSEDEE